MNLDGRKALVTGGARRIGRALCVGLSGAGARVAIHYHHSESEAAEVEAACAGSVRLQADLMAGAAVCDELVGRAEEALGGLDLLVNNAAIYERRPLAEVSEEDWDRHLALNLKAPFFCARAAGLRMRGRGHGVILNVGDWAALRPYPGYLPYFAAKAGMLALTAGLARELAPGVRVNGIAPGPILTPENASEAHVEAVRKATPLGGFGGEESIVQTALFLIGNDFVTGETITVDGGRSLR